MTLSDVKLYLRIDSDAEDELLTVFMNVAEDYVRDAVSDYDTKAVNSAFVIKSEMCQKIIIADLYENREVGTSKDFGYTVRSMITQLQYMPCEVV